MEKAQIQTVKVVLHYKTALHTKSTYIHLHLVLHLRVATQPQ